MFIKKYFKQLVAHIKLWGWYEWVKYILAGLLFGLGVCLAVFSVCDSGTRWLTFLTIGFFLVLPIFAIARLICRDYRLPYIVLIFLCGVGLYWSLQGLGVFYDNFPRLIDVIDIILIIVSVICLIKTTRNTRARKNTCSDILSKISFVIACVWCGLILLGMFVFSSMPDEDSLRLEIARECVETKVAAGYPRDFAREFCLGPSEFCAGRTYSENCDPELYCCFATVAEDKKWNYLDYDDRGNKISE